MSLSRKRNVGSERMMNELGIDKVKSYLWVDGFFI